MILCFLILFPRHDDSCHSRIALHSSLHAVALKIQVVNKVLCLVDNGAMKRQPVFAVGFGETDYFGIYTPYVSVVLLSSSSSWALRSMWNRMW